VVEGLLASWDTSDLSNGIWMIRLVVYDAAGDTQENRVSVSIDNSLQVGWPQKVLYGGGSYNGSMVVGDLDGDGKLEVVSGSAAGLLYAWHADGTTVKGFPVYVGGYSGNALTPTLGDVDGNGDLEIAVGANTTHPYGVYEDLHLLRSDGTPMPGWPKISGNYISSSIAMADLDGNGTLELIVNEQDWKVHAYYYDGRPVAGWPVDLQHGQAASAVAVGDLDDDGNLEILATQDEGLYAWRADGTPVAGFPVPIVGGGAQPILADLDKDEHLEIIVKAGPGMIHVFSNNGTEVSGWPKNVGAIAGGGFPCAGDIDNDGFVEIVVPGDDNKVHVFRGNASYLPGWPRSFGFHNSAWVSTCTIGDIDGDGQRDIVLPAYDSYLGIYYLYAFRKDGTVLLGWPKLDVDEFQSPVLADLDVDGDVEVIAMAPYRGMAGVNVYAWDLPSTYSPATMDWPMLGQNAQHTSRLPLDLGGTATLSGQILYYSGTRQPVQDVNVMLQGATSTSTLTAPDGMFSLTNVAIGQDWRLAPMKIGEVSDGISALDAAYILQHAVGLRALDANQQLACDVSGNGTISALDAARILQYKVGIISQLPVGSDWLFVPNPKAVANQQVIAPNVPLNRPGMIIYHPLTQTADYQDFTAILFGDCTGNWQPPVQTQ
jgi:hypothetical protein